VQVSFLHSTYTTPTQLNRLYIYNSPLLLNLQDPLNSFSHKNLYFVEPHNSLSLISSSPLHTKMAPISPILRMVTQRRALSIFSRARALVRTVEPHPFERLPITQKAAKADWGKQIRHVGDAAMLYVPFSPSFHPRLLYKG